MKQFLLDTNICIHYLKQYVGQVSQVVTRI
jgi:hypothetical protein